MHAGEKERSGKTEMMRTTRTESTDLCVKAVKGFFMRSTDAAGLAL